MNHIFFHTITMKTSSSTLVIALCFIAPIHVFAQEVSTLSGTQPTAENTPLTGEFVVENLAPLIDLGSVVSPIQIFPQGMETGQQTAEGSNLENTLNPQEANVQPGIDPNASATEVGTTAPPAVVIVIDPVSPIGTLPIDPVTVVPVTTVMPSPVVAPPVQIYTPQDLEPEKTYAFTIEGNAIATKSTPDWAKDGSKKTVSKQVYAVPTFVTDSVTGDLTISGKCADPYFVVLIYQKAQDYDKSPTSYVFNKAFDCTGGQYSYDLKELPPSISKGTYYLLIGGQGDSGSWKPITALTPVTIEKLTNSNTDE